MHQFRGKEWLLLRQAQWKEESFLPAIQPMMGSFAPEQRPRLVSRASGLLDGNNAQAGDAI